MSVPSRPTDRALDGWESAGERHAQPAPRWTRDRVALALVWIVLVGAIAAVVLIAVL